MNLMVTQSTKHRDLYRFRPPVQRNTLRPVWRIVLRPALGCLGFVWWDWMSSKGYPYLPLYTPRGRVTWQVPQSVTIDGIQSDYNTWRALAGLYLLLSSSSRAGPLVIGCALHEGTQVSITVRYNSDYLGRVKSKQDKQLISLSLVIKELQRSLVTPASSEHNVNSCLIIEVVKT